MKKTLLILLLVTVAFFTFIGCDKKDKLTAPSDPEDFYRVDASACKACGNCIEVCPYNAIDIIGGKAVINQGKCRQCGECVAVCPEQAIQ